MEIIQILKKNLQTHQNIRIVKEYGLNTSINYLTLRM